MVACIAYYVAVRTALYYGGPLLAPTFFPGADERRFLRIMSWGFAVPITGISLLFGKMVVLYIWCGADRACWYD